MKPLTSKRRAEKWAERNTPLKGDDDMYDAVGVAIYEAFLAGVRHEQRRVANEEKEALGEMGLTKEQWHYYQEGYSDGFNQRKKEEKVTK